MCYNKFTMKIIHTADIHLDSPLIGVKDPVLRRMELLRALKRLDDYAKNIKAEAVIVAGDLFDDKFTKEQTVLSVAAVINESASKWFVLRGNHGSSAPYSQLQTLCGVSLFGSDWTQYRCGNVAIVGRELGTDDEINWRNLKLDSSLFNVVVLHGDVDSGDYGFIDKKTLAGSGANYIALGHRHSFAEFKFGSVKACYSGALEARGFDETAQSGFVVIDTDSGRTEFVQQFIRRVETVNFDVTGICSEIDLETKLLEKTSKLDTDNYLNLILSGAAAKGVRCEYVAANVLGNRFFALRVKDETKTEYDLSALKEEISLRGEFVKLASDIQDEQLRRDVIKMGLAALNGEELL